MFISTNTHLLYTTLATLGRIFILVSSQTVFLIIKILGVAYIIYLGLKIFRMHIKINKVFPIDNVKKLTYLDYASNIILY